MKRLATYAAVASLIGLAALLFHAPVDAGHYGVASAQFRVATPFVPQMAYYAPVVQQQVFASPAYAASCGAGTCNVQGGGVPAEAPVFAAPQAFAAPQMYAPAAAFAVPSYGYSASAAVFRQRAVVARHVGVSRAVVVPARAVVVPARNVVVQRAIVARAPVTRTRTVTRSVTR